MSPGHILEHRKRAGRLLLVGFDGVELPPHIVQQLENDSLLGIILFKRNVESPAQVAALNRAARRAAPASRPPVIAVDQEGGRVVRLRHPLTVLPPARTIGAKNSPELTQKAGQLVGRELSSLGFTLNFAPVLDVDTHPNSPIIGDRAYGREADTVTRHGLAFAQGLLKGGVVPCAKHFPGHGDADLDSHADLPVVSHSRGRLEAVETAPFAAWARAGLGPVMTAHVVYPALDAEPATLSRDIIEKELRGRLGFSGPVLTDDLEMGALARFGGPGAVAVRAVNASADGLLVCRSAAHIEAVTEALAEEATNNPDFARRLDEAAKRLDSLRRTPACDESYIGSTAHAAQVREITDAF
jgi:beta-N-acetylhexosaminidase